MGGGVQAVEGVDAGNLGVGGTDDPDVRQGKPGRRPQPEPCEVDAVAAWRHAQDIYPEFLTWLRLIADPRKRPERATFPTDYLLLLALLMLGGQCGSRRQLGRELAGGRLSANVWKLVGKACDAVCHTDTMNQVMEGIDPTGIEQIIVRLAGRLRERKMLRRFLLNGNLVVAMDGVQIMRVKHPVGEGWLTQTKDGKTTYSRYVLAAKIVTSCGLVVPFAYEFIENPAELAEFDKQDCELKASRRLIDKIHQLYPPR